MPIERKSVEPMAMIALAQVAAKHQSLLHFVGNAPWSDAAMLAKVGELVLHHARITDLEAASVWTLLVGVSGTSLVLGRVSGTLFSLLGAVAHNLLVVPPALSFTVPMPAEIVRLAGCVTLALLLPALAESAHELRRALSAGSSPNAGAAAVQSRD